VDLTGKGTGKLHEKCAAHKSTSVAIGSWHIEPGVWGIDPARSGSAGYSWPKPANRCAIQGVRLSVFIPEGGQISSGGGVWRELRAKSRARSTPRALPASSETRSARWLPTPAAKSRLLFGRLSQVQQTVDDGGFRVARLQARSKHLKRIGAECRIVWNVAGIGSAIRQRNQHGVGHG
jgi:hypothetical protein